MRLTGYKIYIRKTRKQRSNENFIGKRIQRRADRRLLRWKTTRDWSVELQRSTFTLIIHAAQRSTVAQNVIYKTRTKSVTPAAMKSPQARL